MRACGLVDWHPPEVSHNGELTVDFLACMAEQSVANVVQERCKAHVRDVGRGKRELTPVIEKGFAQAVCLVDDAKCVFEPCVCRRWIGEERVACLMQLPEPLQKRRIREGRLVRRKAKSTPQAVMHNLRSPIAGRGIREVFPNEFLNLSADWGGRRAAFPN